MIEALQSPPSAIATQAPAAIAQLQQILASANANSNGVTAPTAEQAEANETVNSYLQNNCGIPSTDLFANK